MDRDIFLFEKMNEIYDNKISFMIESLDNQLKINMLDAQYEIVNESGTKEDFEYLYMEAQEETKEKKKNIFNGIIDWVDKIKNRLVDFFKSKKIEKQIDKLPNEVQIDEGYKKQFEGFKKFHDWIVKPINLFKQKKYGKMLADLVKKGAQIVGVCTGVSILHNTVKYYKPDLKKCADWILKVFKTDCDSIIKALKPARDHIEWKVDQNPSYSTSTNAIELTKDCVRLIGKVCNAAMHWCIVVPSKAVATFGGNAVAAVIPTGGFVQYKDIDTRINKFRDNHSPLKYHSTRFNKELEDYLNNSIQ